MGKRKPLRKKQASTSLNIMDTKGKFRLVDEEYDKENLLCDQNKMNKKEFNGRSKTNEIKVLESTFVRAFQAQ